MKNDRLLHRVRHGVLILCVILWMGAFTATHVPGEDLPEFHTSDTVLHVTGFAGLASTFFVTLAAYGVSRIHRIPTGICIMMIYAALDESTQPFFHRSQDIMDWLADLGGTALALLLCEAFLLLLARLRLYAEPAPAKLGPYQP